MGEIAMRFFGKQVVPVLLVGVLACGSVFGFKNDLPADYAPEITYCPPGLEAFKNAHTVALAEAAVACSEMDLLADAFLFFQASKARSAVDRRLLVPEDALEEQTAFETRALALRFKFGCAATKESHNAMPPSLLISIAHYSLFFIKRNLIDRSPRRACTQNDAVLKIDDVPFSRTHIGIAE